MKFLQDYAELLACLSFLIPLIPGWILFHRLSGDLKLFIYILSIVFIMEYAGYYTSSHGIHNLVLYNILYISQFYFYSILFRKLLPSDFSKWFIRIIVLLFTIYVGIKIERIIFPNDVYNSYIPSFLSLSVILYCILFFNQQLNDMKSIFIYKTPWFWIVTSLLFYFSGSFLILLFTNYFMFREREYIMSLWLLLHLLNIVKNLLAGIGMIFIITERWKKSF